MRITHLKNENFRSIQSLEIGLDETTVFAEPGNAGKIAIIDALRIVRIRGCEQHDLGFGEYDIRLACDESGSKRSGDYCKYLIIGGLPPVEAAGLSIETSGADHGLVHEDAQTCWLAS